MTIDEALMAYLKAYSGLVALVDTRIHFDERPQGSALPAAVIIDVSNAIQYDHNGPIDVEQPNKQFTAYAVTRAGARAVADQLRAALNDFHGTQSGLDVQPSVLLNDLTTIEAGADGTTRVYMVDLEYEITYTKE